MLLIEVSRRFDSRKPICDADHFGLERVDTRFDVIDHGWPHTLSLATSASIAGREPWTPTRDA
jgi:hypothetical protein